jgi:hypothetical protein
VQADYWRAKYDHALGELKKWVGFGVAEAQQVENADGRTRDAVAITSGCEKRDAASIRKATKRGLF